MSWARGFKKARQHLDWLIGMEGRNDSTKIQGTVLFDDGDIIVAMSQGVKAIGEVKRRIDGYWLMYPSWQHGELLHIVENVDTGETGVEIIGNMYELERVEK